jgi:hypothetical protein
MGRISNTHDEGVMNVKFWSGNLKERYSFEGLGVGGRRHVLFFG